MDDRIHNLAKKIHARMKAGVPEEAWNVYPGEDL